MSTLSNRNSSSGSGGFTRRGGERERGFPKSCRRCGLKAEIWTSKTKDNPGRLFHGCPNGFGEDKTHLFKWTDESVVEEIDDMKVSIDEKIGNIELESRSYEALVNGYGKKIEDLNVAVVGFGKEMEELKDKVQKYEKEVKSLKNMKNMIMVGFGLMVFYYYMS